MSPERTARTRAASTIRGVLALLAKRSRLSNDELEDLFERVDDDLRTLPPEPWVFDVLDRVVGKSAAKKRDAIFVLVTLAAAEGAQERILRYLEDPSPAIRQEVVTAIHRQRWVHLAPVLAKRLRVEKDPSCRNALVVACGDLRVPATTDALLAIAKRDLRTKSDDRHRLLFHLRRHRDPRARPYFQAVFDEPLPDPPVPFDGAKETKVLAAWALCTLGDAPDAHAFLVAMLDDTKIFHVREGQLTGVEPGVSERAAQALADVHGWPFRWGRGDAKSIRRRVRRKA